MWGYYDESGEYEGGNGRLVNMTVGGCFAPLDAWLQFDPQWRKILADEGLDFFHMTDFESYVPPFDFKLANGERDKQRHNRLINSLLDLMFECVDGFYGFGAVYRPDLHPAATHADLMEDCVAGAIKNAVLDVADFYGDQLCLVFGNQNHCPESKIRRYVDFYDYGAAKGRIKTMSTAEMKCTTPLQAADIFAYEMARAQRPNRPERYPFQRIVDHCRAANKKMLLSWGPIRSSRADLRTDQPRRPA